eukprot:SAG22_NODE_7255_length_757_cov_1.528875_1_plen_191_part_01
MLLVFALAAAAAAAVQQPVHVDVSEACIVATSGTGSGPAGPHPVRVARWLAAEVSSRVRPDRGGWQHDGATPSGVSCAGAAVVHLAVAGSRSPRAPDLAAAQQPEPPQSPCGPLPAAANSFLLQVSGRGTTIKLDAADDAGLQSGAGRLLRELHMPARQDGGNATIPADLCVRYDGARALWKIRGHQISVN